MGDPLADERSVEAVAAAALRRTRTPGAKSGPEPRAVLAMVGGDRGQEMAVDLEWVLSRDRRDRLAVPVQYVQACRSSIAAAGRPHGVIWVDAASAGPLSANADGTTSAPIEARIAYERAGSVQTRHSHVTCQLGPEGTVVALK